MVLAQILEFWNRVAPKPADPDAERRHWYRFYLNSERGRAALAEDRHGFCKALWNDFSPRGCLAMTSTSEWSHPSTLRTSWQSCSTLSPADRRGRGDPALEQIEQRLAKRPKITMPTIALAGADDGVDPPAACDQVTPYFTDLRRYATLLGVGHNLPQDGRGCAATERLNGNHENRGDSLVKGKTGTAL